MLCRCFSKAGRDIQETVTTSDGPMAICRCFQGFRRQAAFSLHVLPAIGRKVKEFGSPITLGVPERVKGVIHVRRKKTCSLTHLIESSKSCVSMSWSASSSAAKRQEMGA